MWLALPASDTIRTLIELRAAEIIAHARGNCYGRITATEYDWFVHGDSLTPSVGDNTPETDEEWAEWLAHQIDGHARAIHEHEG